MSKKHFQELATRFGLLLRNAISEGEASGIRLASREVADVCASTNPNFDRARFMTWIEETAAGARDAQGRKVA
jgi:hypothetical protein